MEKLSEIKQKEDIDAYANNMILFVIGATASGKTKLSLELAKKLGNVEIVNADSMQMYKEADILTAKATAEEQSIVKHHLLDVLELKQEDFNRNMYYEMAVEVLIDIFKRGKVPLVVGGTNYYIETLLFSDYDLLAAGKESVTNDSEHKDQKNIANDDQSKDLVKNEDITIDIDSGWIEQSSAEKYKLLQKIDKAMAERLHPNDTRRVENYIKLYISEGILPSKKLLEANEARRLRFKNPIIFWPKWEKNDNLGKKVAERIDEMIDAKGLLEIVEIFDYAKNFELKTGQPLKGVFQSIGYKEFDQLVNWLYREKGNTQNIKEFLASIQNVSDLDTEALELLKECKAKLTNSTIQYAKRQLTWIKSRFSANTKLNQRLFKLEFDTAENFKTEQIPRALGIVEDCLQGKFDLLSDASGGELYKKDSWKQFYCDKCQVYCQGEKLWKTHTTSKRHRKSLKNIERNFKYIEDKLNKPKAIDQTP